MQLYNYFESYLFNKLTVAERQEFESRLKSDISFKEDFEAHKTMQGALDVLVEVDVMKHIATLDKKPNTIPMKKDNSNRRWFSIAASLLFLAAAFFVANNYLEPKENSFITELRAPIEPGTRSSDEALVVENDYYTITKPAYDFVEKNKYKEAAQLFESYLSQFTGDELKRVEWDLALVISTFDMERSRALLFNISNDKDSPFMKKAKGLLVK